MITDQFSAILQELAKALQISKLEPDVNNSCLIKFKGGIQIQIEPDKENKFLIVGTDLGTVPSGHYRENIFAEALKANGMPLPRYGFFSYAAKKDHLILSEQLPLRDLTGEKVHDFLTPFLEKVKVWKEALARGEVPVVVTATTSRPMGMFGIRR